MCAAPSAYTQSTSLIWIATADTEYSFNIAVRVLAQRMQKVSFVFRREISKHELKGEFSRLFASFRGVYVLCIEAWIGVVSTGQQRAKSVYDGCLSGVVWSQNYV